MAFFILTNYNPIRVYHNPCLVRALKNPKNKLQYRFLIFLGGNWVSQNPSVYWGWQFLKIMENKNRHFLASICTVFTEALEGWRKFTPLFGIWGVHLYKTQNKKSFFFIHLCFLLAKKRPITLLYIDFFFLRIYIYIYKRGWVV